MDTTAKDVNLPIVEHLPLRQERRKRLLERIRQAEAKYEATEDCKPTHKDEQPEPSRLASNSAHVQDAVGEQFRRGLTELVTKVEDHYPFCRFRSRVPRGKRPKTPRNEARLRDTEQEASCDERRVVRLEGLERAHGAEQKELQSEPLAGSHAVERHVGRDLEEHDAER